MTAIADEIAKLDNGTFVGWARTGKAVQRLSERRGGTACGLPVLQHRVRPEELALLYAGRAGVHDGEGQSELDVRGEVFSIRCRRSTVSCAAGTNPVYRVYNNGQGGAPNHRYTTELAVRNAMIALGWIAEGYGSIGVIMCAPQ